MARTSCELTIDPITDVCWPQGPIHFEASPQIRDAGC